jgi:hypothetical protein
MFLGPDDVDMVLAADLYEKISALPAYEEADEIMIHYTVTQECPFNCRGCINALTAGKGNRGRSDFFPEANKGQDLERDLRGIARLIKDSGKKAAVIVYYGGRCPVQANTGGIGRARQYCFMMREYVKALKQHAAQIAGLMVEKGITPRNLYRSAHLTKFADVTP